MKNCLPTQRKRGKNLRGKSKRANNEKLLCTLEDKDFYVLHYRNLKLYLQLGLQIKHIHGILEFQQEAWLKPYIDFNTRNEWKRKQNLKKKKKLLQDTQRECIRQINRTTAFPLRCGLNELKS